MTLQAEAFHLLERADGVRPFDGERLYLWARTATAGDAARHAVRVMLELQTSSAIDYFDEKHVGDLGRFHAVEAVDSWDSHNRTAFTVWAAEPWWADRPGSRHRGATGRLRRPWPQGK